MTMVKELTAERDRLRAALEEAKEDILSFGNHDWDCKFIQPPRNLAINGGEVEGDRSAVGFVDCRRNSHTKYLFSVKSTHGNKASL